jgi:hypothetical protein
VTAAAVLLIIGGALGLLGGLLLFTGAGVAAGSGVGGIFVVLGLIFLAVGALELYAGIQVLSLKEVGRKIGVVLAAISGVLSLLSIGRTPGTSIIQIAIDVFIIWALTTNASLFTP